MVRRGASSGSLQVCRRDIATVRPASQCFNVIGVDVFTYDYDSSTAPALTNPSSTMMMTTIACDMDLLGLTSVRTIILRQCSNTNGSVHPKSVGICAKLMKNRVFQSNEFRCCLIIVIDYFQLESIHNVDKSDFNFFRLV